MILLQTPPYLRAVPGLLHDEISHRIQKPQPKLLVSMETKLGVQHMQEKCYFSPLQKKRQSATTD